MAFSDHLSPKRLVEAPCRRVRRQAADPERRHAELRQVGGYCPDEAAAVTLPVLALSNIEDTDLPRVFGRIFARCTAYRKADDLSGLVLGHVSAVPGASAVGDLTKKSYPVPLRLVVRFLVRRCWQQQQLLRHLIPVRRPPGIDNDPGHHRGISLSRGSDDHATHRTPPFSVSCCSRTLEINSAPAALPGGRAGSE